MTSSLDKILKKSWSIISGIRESTVWLFFTTRDVTALPIFDVNKVGYCMQGTGSQRPAATVEGLPSPAIDATQTAPAAAECAAAFSNQGYCVLYFFGICVYWTNRLTELCVINHMRATIGCVIKKVPRAYSFSLLFDIGLDMWYFLCHFILIQAHFFMFVSVWL